MNGFEVLEVNVIPVVVESDGLGERKMHLSDLMNLDLPKLLLTNVQAGVQQQQALSVGKEVKETVNKTESIMKQHEANIIRALKNPPKDELWSHWYYYARILIFQVYHGVGATSVIRHINLLRKVKLFLSRF